MSNILLLTHIGAENPKSGGEQRISAIIKNYERHGHKVIVSGVAGNVAYNGMHELLPMPKQPILESFFYPITAMEDYCVGKFSASESSKMLRHIQRIIHETKIDFIQIEMPWFIELALLIKKKINLCAGAKIIYSSHNVESPLKQKIYLDLNGFSSPHEDARMAVEELERMAVIESDKVFTVSDYDSQVYRQLYNKQACITPNGTYVNGEDDRLHCPFSGITNFSANKRYVCYVASGYKPNVDSFYSVFSGGSPFHSGLKLMIIGSAGSSIRNHADWKKLGNLINHIIFWENVKQAELGKLLAFSSAIVIPITHGGGSSLKTADALMAGVPVITTSVGIRGFESYIGQTNIFIADSPIQFKSEISRVIEKDLPPITREGLDWQSCLAPMLGYVSTDL
jgi:glycosyltransferase involved in cell wall biosynthesis